MHLTAILCYHLKFTMYALRSLDMPLLISI